MLFLWILLGLVALLLFLLLMPVTIRLSYGEDLNIKISYLFLSFRFLPGQEPSPKKRRFKKAVKSDQEPDGAKKKKRGKRSLEEMIDLISAYASLGANILKSVLRRMVIVRLQVRMRVARGDAYETALAYGRIQAIAHTLLALLKNACRVKQAVLDIRPDFLGEEDSLEAFCKLRIQPLWLIIDLLRILPKIDLDVILDRRPEAKKQPIHS